MFQTVAYRGGYIQYSTFNNVERIYAQYWPKEGGPFEARPCKSRHAAMCFLAKQAKKK